MAAAGDDSTSCRRTFRRRRWTRWQEEVKRLWCAARLLCASVVVVVLSLLLMMMARKENRLGDRICSTSFWSKRQGCAPSKLIPARGEPGAAQGASSSPSDAAGRGSHDMVPDVLKKTMVMATQHFPPGEILLMSPAASFGTQRTVASGWHALQESLKGHKRITLRPPKPASFNASLFICPSPPLLVVSYRRTMDIISLGFQ